jgi:pimeloyl-ACP methyl ester carboxylesterase
MKIAAAPSLPGFLARALPFDRVIAPDLLGLGLSDEPRSPRARAYRWPLRDPDPELAVEGRHLLE